MRPHGRTYVSKWLVGKTKSKWACVVSDRKSGHVLWNASDGGGLFCGFRQVNLAQNSYVRPAVSLIALLSHPQFCVTFLFLCFIESSTSLFGFPLFFVEKISREKKISACEEKMPISLERYRGIENLAGASQRVVLASPFTAGNKLLLHGKDRSTAGTGRPGCGSRRLIGLRPALRDSVLVPSR